jgi:hypothetical protein
MGRQERFRKSCATVALKTYYRSQDALATGLRAELKLPDNRISGRWSRGI